MAGLARATATLLPLEAAWFAFALPHVYRPALTAVQGGAPLRVRLWVPPLAYATVLFSLWFFVLREARDRGEAARRATALAVAMYGVYNLTNLTFLSAYPVWVGALDTAWGVAVLNVAAQAGYGG